VANLATGEGDGAAARTAGDGEAIFLGYLAWQQRHCQSARRRYVICPPTIRHISPFGHHDLLAASQSTWRHGRRRLLAVQLLSALGE
jgi:hypothetical protein